MSDKKEYIERLERIEKKLDQLISKKQYYDTLNICSVCGKRWDYVEAYYCINSNCPKHATTTWEVTSISAIDSWYDGRARRDNMSNPGDKDYSD